MQAIKSWLAPRDWHNLLVEGLAFAICGGIGALIRWAYLLLLSTAPN